MLTIEKLFTEAIFIMVYVALKIIGFGILCAFFEMIQRIFILILLFQRKKHNAENVIPLIFFETHRKFKKII